MKVQHALATALCAASLLIPLQAQIPQTISYQGMIADSLGAPKPDDTYSFTFHLYNDAVGGSALWSETKDLPVRGGLFHTLLGDQIPLGTALSFAEPYWLGIQLGTELELSPRIPLASVAYSFRAMGADSAQHAARADTAKFVTAEVTATNLADGAVTSAKILDGTVGTVDLADSSVTQAKLAAGVTLPPGGSAGGDLTGTYPNPVIADAAVTSAKILDGTIQRSDMVATFKAPFADSSDHALSADTSDFALAAALTGPAGGDLTGTYPNPAIADNTVTSAKINPSGAQANQVLTYNGSNVVWLEPPVLVADITAVAAGAGLTDDGTTGDVTLSVAFAGSGIVDSVAHSDHGHAGEDITSGIVADAQIDAAIARDSEILSLILGSDGSSSTLDADLLDGQEATAFAAATHAHSSLDADDGAYSDVVYVDSLGNVGIGTTTPDNSAQLHIMGKVFINSPTHSDEEVHIAENTGSTDAVISLEHTLGRRFEFHSNSDGTFHIKDGDAANGVDALITFDAPNTRVGIGKETGITAMLHVDEDSDREVARFESDEGNLVVVDKDGNVGIGTDNPLKALHVVGTIKASAVTTDSLVVVGNVSVESTITAGSFTTNGDVSVGGSLTTDSLTTTGGVSVNGNLSVAGGMVVSVVDTNTSSYTATTSDRVILADASFLEGGMTVSLPPATSADGQLLTIRNKYPADGSVFVTPYGTETIEGSAGISLSDLDGIIAVTIVSVGTGWWVISDMTALPGGGG